MLSIVGTPKQRGAVQKDMMSGLDRNTLFLETDAGLDADGKCRKYEYKRRRCQIVLYIDSKHTNGTNRILDLKSLEISIEEVACVEVFCRCTVCCKLSFVSVCGSTRKAVNPEGPL